MTQRWKLTLEYDGTPFAGWQKQEHDLTVQGCLEKAVHLFSGETVTAHVAGRTDAGVHAAGQVAHIDLEKPSDKKTVRDAINYHMRPHPAAILAAEPVSDEFHARFKAVNRVYCYKILMGRSAEPMILKNRVWHIWQTLDIDRMNAGAKHLLGKHDFSSFRSAACQAKSPVRSIDRLEFIEKDCPIMGRHVEMWAEARSFLHHQIRNIVGTLRNVGEGKNEPGDVKKILETCDRTQAGAMAPAHGLYFMRVDYSE